MLPPSLLSAIKLAFAQKPLPQAAATDPVPKTGQFELNQKYQGTVQAQIAPGTFKVRVADQIIQMQLPAMIRSGDTVALQVISIRPRLTFNMVSSANPLSTPEQLGSTARMLSSLSQQAPEKAFVRAAQNTPIWEKTQPPEGKPLAGLLREALANSGLFYESHQAQWVQGSRSTAQLRQEPQNLPPDQARAVVANNAASITAPTNNIVAPPMAEDIARNVTTNANNIPTAFTQTAAPTPQEAKASNVPEHLQPLVQQQLNALETRQMLWQGYVWPGQTMQWEIHDQAPRTSQAEDQRQWATELKLDLPNLGGVTAMLRLNSAGMNLTLKADKPETRAMLGSASTQLLDALKKAGIPVLGAQVAAP
ncbi:MAG: flagellar hook-length control protein FliK [Nitrosomonadales bacterium]|nr:flagellar hook-length control protein FliK [Nitrosomonadales bacterium]